MKKLDINEHLFLPKIALQVAEELQANDEGGWTYRVVHDPKGCGWSYINVYDADGVFVARY